MQDPSSTGDIASTAKNWPPWLSPADRSGEVTRVAWRMTPPIKRPRLAWHPDVPRTAEEAEKQLEDALKASMQRIACPVCGETWPESDIARHASACGVSSNKDTTVQQWAAIFPPTKKPPVSYTHLTLPTIYSV